MERKSGFYWIKEKGEPEWSVAFYIGGSSMEGWMMCGIGRNYLDSDFEKINENRIMSPDEWE